MIHHVYANRTNIGDWLAARGIQSLLGSQTIVEHLCDEPFVDETMLALSQCTAEDLVVIGGGGLFMDYFLPFWEGLLRVAGGLRYGIWGVGYCDLKLEASRPPTELLQEIVARSQFCYVRDELTRSYLAECHLPPSVPCPSLVVVHQGVQPHRGLLHVDNYTTAGADVFEAMQAYGEDFAKQTDRPFRRTNNQLNPANEQRLRATLDLYGQSDLVLSSALHGCLVAVAMGKKVLAVSGDRKIESCMEAFGLGDWVIDARNVHDVPQRLQELDMQHVSLPVVEKARLDNRRIASEVHELAANAIDLRAQSCTAGRRIGKPSSGV